MTFYSEEVKRITKDNYPHNDLTKKIISSKLFIDKHFADDLNLDAIASKAHVSKFHFLRLFKKYYGKTPNQYLQEVRIESAKKFFKKGKSIDHVCSAIGFASKTTFISLFKKFTGTTPSTWQNKKAILKNK